MPVGRNVAVAVATSAMLCAALAPAARAQSIGAADSLLARGALTRAEAMYYAVARARPHDPAARLALGRYLVARGARRVGATLLEEAIRFGGEPMAIGRELAPVYLAVGEYGQLQTLAGASSAERQRAAWLTAHDTRVVAPDSVLVALFRPSNDSDSDIVGYLPMRINGRTVDAAISAREPGIVVGDSVAAARLHRFSTLGVADSLGIGRLAIRNVPVSIDVRLGGPAAIVGLGALAQFAPTFDPLSGRVTLRVSGSVPRLGRGQHLVTLSGRNGLEVLQAGGWLSLTDPRIARLLRARPWTLDAKRGQLILGL
jgi:hypothetical protein